MGKDGGIDLSREGGFSWDGISKMFNAFMEWVRPGKPEAGHSFGVDPFAEMEGEYRGEDLRTLSKGDGPGSDLR